METNNQQTKPENWVSIEGLYNAGYLAHTGTSFSPEKRGKQIVIDYEGQLNEDLQSIPNFERSAYIENYKKYLFAWLRSKAQCISTMIAGPSNFPVRRAEKANRTEQNRYTEFQDWRERAKKSIARRIEDAKPEVQKNAERWEKIKRNIESSIHTIIAIDNGINTYSSRPLFVSSITEKIKTLAKNADSEMVERSLNLIKEWNEKSKKPIITEKNSIWKLLEVCEVNREKQVDRANTESNEYEINGVKIVKNFQADRLQLYFDGKPESNIIQTLKSKAFKWSPSNGCWQRQLTQNAVYAAETLLKQLPNNNQ